MSRSSPPPDMISRESLEKTMMHLHRHELDAEDFRIAEATCRMVIWLTDELIRKKLTIKRLQTIIWSSSERSEKLIPTADTANDDKASGGADTNDDGKPCDSSGNADTPSPTREGKKKPKKPGHGRCAAGTYTGAKQVDISHETAASGDTCPYCHEGKLYRFTTPGIIITLSGQAPLTGTVYRLERFRCSSCGSLTTASPPPEAEKKWDESAPACVAVMKYGHGIPFNRISHLQKQSGIPLSPSTLWQMVLYLTCFAEPVFHVLWYQAAQAFLFHHDDTKVRIRYLPQTFPDEEKSTPVRKRTGLFTTGIIAQHEDHQIILYQSGRRHAGENLDRLLDQREPTQTSPLVMCDALSSNVPPNHTVRLCNCNTHGRRQFADLVDYAPVPCLHVLEVYKNVYRHDADTKERKMSPSQRLAYHVEHTKPLMDDFSTWLLQQREENLAEPNSPLMDAIKYMLRHWDALTMFLTVEGAPVDNNCVERALKMVVLHRKNS